MYVLQCYDYRMFFVFSPLFSPLFTFCFAHKEIITIGPTREGPYSPLELYPYELTISNMLLSNNIYARFARALMERLF